MSFVSPTLRKTISDEHFKTNTRELVSKIYLYFEGFKYALCVIIFFEKYIQCIC